MAGNQNVDIMRGEPEKAVKVLAIPIMISMVLTSLYNIIDGIWIAGLGTSTIAGIGFVTPIFMILNGVSVGLGSGATSSISRFVGAHDDENANQSAMHSLLIFIIASIILTVVFVFIQEPLLRMYGASGIALKEGLNYSTPLFLGLTAFIFTNGASGILRGEGDMKRPMYAVIVSVILNAILDPIFIYTLGLGASGASLATILSSAISAAIILYWILVKKDTYVKINFKKFKYAPSTMKDILKVGIPASLDILMISIAMGLFLSIITSVGGDYGVASYSSGQRFYLFAIMPLTAIGSAVVAVVGSGYGAENGDFISRALRFGAKFGFIFGLVLSAILVIFSTPLATIFAYTPETNYLIPGIASFMQIVCLSLPFTGAGMASSYFYQGIGKGYLSLLFTILREVILAVLFIYYLGVVLELGLVGVWMGLAIGRIIASIANYISGRYTVKVIRKKLGT